MLDAVDKVDSAHLTAEEITDPTGWILLGYIMDPRTGLGRYRDYRISNYQLMLDMIEYCRSMSAEEIMEVEDVKERIEKYKQDEPKFIQMLKDNATVYGNALVLDLRNQDPIYCGNRFMVYTLFPDCNISVRIIWGFKKQNVVFTVGHSILNRTSKTDVGKLMLLLRRRRPQGGRHLPGLGSRSLGDPEETHRLHQCGRLMSLIQEAIAQCNARRFLSSTTMNALPKWSPTG